MKRKLLFLLCALLTSAGMWAGILDGWTQVTTLDNLKDQPEDYFFAIFSEDGTLMLETNSSGTYSTRLCYKTAEAPLNSAANLFEIENYESDKFVLKSTNLAKYFTNSSASWDFMATRNHPGDDCPLTIICSDSKYTIRATRGDDNNYLGPWDNTVKAGERLAGNKGSSGAASFLIYRKAKANINLTTNITNPSFESNSNDELPTGWTLSNEAWETRVKDTSGKFTMSNSDGSRLFNTWIGGVGSTISQTLNNMPAGKYKLTAVMASDGENELQLTAGGSTGTAAAEGEGIGVTVTTYVILSQTGNLAISAKEKDNKWYKADNFQLTYISNNAADCATAFTSGSSASVKTWYSYDVPSDGWYNFIPNTATSFEYTQTGTQSTGIAAYAPATKGKALYLSEGTLYFRCDAAATVTISSAASLSANDDATKYLNNPSFESGDILGWSTTLSDDTGARDATNNDYKFTSSDGSYIFNTWRWNDIGGNAISQTVSHLPAGVYKLTAVMATKAENTFRLKANNNTGTASSTDKGTGVTVTTYTYLAEGADLTISADAGGTTWYKADKFELTYLAATPTDLITNPSFESATDKGQTTLAGWTNEGNSMQTQNNSDFDKTGTYYVERWQSSNSGGLNDKTLTQSVSTLPAGTYKLTAKAQNVEQYNSNAKGTGFYLTAGSEQVMVGTNLQNSVYATLAAAGSLTIGAKTQSCSGNWIAVDDFQLTYVDDLPTGSEIEALVVSGDMNATVSATQTTAVNTYKSSQTVANCNSALTAIADAQVSKAYYVQMNTLITNAPTTYKVTTTLDAAGQAKWADLYADIQSDYENGTYETVAEVETALHDAYITAVKSQGAGSDWTALITNPSFEDEDVSCWTFVNVENGNHREAGGSRGSDYHGTFWRANGKAESTDVYQNVALPAGFYRLEFDAYNNDANTNKWSKVQLYFGDTTKSAELDYKTPRGEYQTYSFEFEVETETTAHLGVTFTSEGTGQIWEYFDSFTLTYLGDASANMAVNGTAKWGTFCAPFDVEIPDGVSAYTCESAPGGVLELTSQSSPIPANTPVILNAEDGLASTTFYGVKVPNESADLITGGLLRGNVSTAAMDVPSDGSAYLLQRNNSKTGFYQVTGTGFKIGYNRCYMVQPTTSAREAFFFEDDNPTAINAIEAAEAKAKGLKDGKYLINGRIVMVNNGRAFGANGQILK